MTLAFMLHSTLVPFRVAIHTGEGLALARNLNDAAAVTTAVTRNPVPKEYRAVTIQTFALRSILV